MVEPGAPPVVAVVVAHDPGDELEACLGSLADQDYPSLSVLVVDNGSATSVVPRVAAVAPTAYVHRIGRDKGFGAAANVATDLVEGASFLLLCHDDVRLARDAVQVLVEEAFRSNAGVVGPKLVRWGEPERLLAVGLAVDQVGVVNSPVEPGELDQAQHDGVREVFAVPSACTLVRADLFATLGGHDPGISLFGEDLDLCWRALVAGARVVVAPEARVEHREALAGRAPAVATGRRRLLAHHRLRTLLVVSGWMTLLRVLPRAALLAVAEAVVSVATGRPGAASDVLSAWPWNLRRLGAVRRRRRLLRRVRAAPDASLRRLQGRGSSRLSSWLRSDTGGGRRPLESLGRGLGERVWARQRRVLLLAVSVVAVLAVVGSRGLVLGRLPAMGGIVPLDEGPGELVGQYLSGWRRAGVGSSAPAPTALGLLGIAGFVLGGAMGILQKLLVVGALFAGLVGIWRLSRVVERPSGRAVALVAYATVALPYDALAGGSWAGLVLYAAAPALLGAVLAAAAVGDATAPSSRAWLARIAGLGLLLALVAALVPAVLVLAPVLAVAAALGRALGGSVRGGVRLVATTTAAAGVGAVLHLPWLADLVASDPTGAATQGVAGLHPAAASAAELLRFDLGPAGGVLGWALPIAAALPLLVATGRRLALAGAAWAVALASWALAVASTRDALGGFRLPPEVVLAPGAAALALAAGAGVAAYELDVRSARFGWRQVAAVVAAGAVVVGVVPIARAAAEGRWGLPEDDLATTLAPLARLDGGDQGGAEGRVLWIGSGRVLPVAGQRLDDRLAVAITDGFGPRVGERWAASFGDADVVLRHALEVAAEGGTDRLGRLLAPFGVRWVVLVERSAPERTDVPLVPVPDALRRALGQQLDLALVDVDPAVVAYANTAAGAPRVGLAVGQSGPLVAEDPLRASAGIDLAAAPAVLDGDAGDLRGRGPVDVGGSYLAEASDGGWRLEVDGEEASRTDALGWANLFLPSAGGEGVLSFRTPIGRHAAVLAQVLAWLAATVLALRRRRSPVADDGDDHGDGEPLRPVVLASPEPPVPVGAGSR